MSSFMSKLLKISENYLYMKPVFSDSVVLHFKYGPLGELLRSNIYNEWIISNVTCRNMNVFSYSDLNHDKELIKGIQQHYLEGKSIVGDLPFSIVYPRISVVQDEDEKTEVEEIKYFRPRNGSIMKCLTFTNFDDGSKFFHFWLRQRKMWWRKFSANPTKFSLTDIKKTEDMEFANIQISFPWGAESIEIIKYFSEKIFENIPKEDQQLWSLSKGKKKKFPCIIESEINLDTTTFVFICEAFVEDIRLDTELPYQVMKLHRKLAPYKIAVIIDTKKYKKNDDLIHLGEYITLNLKKSGISTLFLRNNSFQIINDAFQYYDLLSVPFVAVLDESTLTDGIFGLRSRETTLQERLHISQLTEYMAKLLKNY